MVDNQSRSVLGEVADVEVRSWVLCVPLSFLFLEDVPLDVTVGKPTLEVLGAQLDT